MWLKSCTCMPNHGGGVAVWVKADPAYQHLHHIQCHDHEVIWLTVTTRTRQKIVVCAVYRPGSCSESDVRILEYLDDTLEAARAHGSKIIIAGDFNVHNTAWLGSTKTTKAGELAEDLCALHGLYQHIDQPTRGLNTLDLVLSDFKSPVHVAVQPPIGHSDHAVLRGWLHYPYVSRAQDIPHGLEVQPGRLAAAEARLPLHRLAFNALWHCRWSMLQHQGAHHARHETVYPSKAAQNPPLRSAMVDTRVLRVCQR